jgi:hypothetical protein
MLRNSSSGSGPNGGADPRPSAVAAYSRRPHNRHTGTPAGNRIRMHPGNAGCSAQIQQQSGELDPASELPDQVTQLCCALRSPGDERHHSATRQPHRCRLSRTGRKRASVAIPPLSGARSDGRWPNARTERVAARAGRSPPLRCAAPTQVSAVHSPRQGDEAAVFTTVLPLDRLHDQPDDIVSDLSGNADPGESSGPPAQHAWMNLPTIPCKVRFATADISARACPPPRPTPHPPGATTFPTDTRSHSRRPAPGETLRPGLRRGRVPVPDTWKPD